METPLSICKQLAARIYDMAQAAMTNKEQSRLLADRAQRLVSLVQRTDAVAATVCAQNPNPSLP